jgi:hypothetical protein
LIDHHGSGLAAPEPIRRGQRCFGSIVRFGSEPCRDQAALQRSLASTIQ